MASYLSIPYPSHKEGYWEPVTSTIDWCEENYYATPYIAELVNTLTNLSFIYLTYKGVRNCIQEGHAPVFAVAFLGFGAVGIGSILFHATLKYPMQLVDELSMIYTTCIMFWATFVHRRSASFGLWFGVFNILLSAFITLYYHYLQDPVFHQVAYGVLTAIIVFRSMYVMEAEIRPSVRSKVLRHKQAAIEGHVNGAQKEAWEREDRRDEEIVRQMWVLVAWGLSIFLLGFTAWNLDQHFCSVWRRWRHQVGLPWGILLEGHGWWHLLTAVGAYAYISWGIWLRRCLDGDQTDCEVYWPTWYTLPEVVKIRSPHRVD